MIFFFFYCKKEKNKLYLYHKFARKDNSFVATACTKLQISEFIFFHFVSSLPFVPRVVPEVASDWCKKLLVSRCGDTSTVFFFYIVLIPFFVR